MFTFAVKQKMKSSYFKISGSSAFDFIWNSLPCLPPFIPHNVDGMDTKGQSAFQVIIEKCWGSEFVPST